jgi:pantoate--beta-alanine ligase
MSAGRSGAATAPNAAAVASSTIVVGARVELASARAALPGPVGLVPTMGALHAGHVALLRAARAECASVVVTVFVNPRQFGAGEDLSRYPRDLAADVAICRREGADLVWAPDVAEVYPDDGAEPEVDPGPLGAELEGESRPGHFAGVLTVVATFFALIRPDRAYFGEKDYQQLMLVRRMAAVRGLGVEVVGVPTVRDPDGLALSSRNVYLSPAQRGQAVTLSRALAAGVAAAPGGPAAVRAAAAQVLAAEPAVRTDYLELRAADLGPAGESGPARLLVAAHVGATRLIDNLGLELGSEPDVVPPAGVDAAASDPTDQHDSLDLGRANAADD